MGKQTPLPTSREDFPQFAAVWIWDVLKLIYLWLGSIWHNTISCNELMTGSTYSFFRFSIFSFLLCVFVTAGEAGEGGKKARGPSFFDSLLFFLGTRDKYKQDLDDLKII